MTFRSVPLLLLPAPKRRVSLHDLPDELLLVIFEHLQHVSDIAAVRAVCRAWCRLIDHTETIWRTLVFKLPSRPSTCESAETWYRKAADFGNCQAQVRSSTYDNFLFIPWH